MGDSLAMLDRSVGRLMNLTSKLEIDETTLMLFSADNGGARYWGPDTGGVNGELRGGKPVAREYIARTPTMFDHINLNARVCPRRQDQYVGRRPSCSYDSEMDWEDPTQFGQFQVAIFSGLVPYFWLPCGLCEQARRRVRRVQYSSCVSVRRSESSNDLFLPLHWLPGLP